MTVCGDVEIGGGVTVCDDVNICQGDLNLEDGSINVAGDLTVDGNSSLNNLVVAGETVLEGCVEIDGCLTVNDDVVINGETSINNDLCVNGYLDICGDINVCDGNLNLCDGSVTVSQNLTVSGDLFLGVEQIMANTDATGPFNPSMNYAVTIVGSTGMSGNTTGFLGNGLKNGQLKYIVAGNSFNPSVPYYLDIAKFYLQILLKYQRSIEYNLSSNF